jgi:hypothetical protein
MAYVRGNQGYVMISAKQSDNVTKATPVYTGTIASGEDFKTVKPQKQVLTDRIRNNNRPSIVQLGKIHTEGSMTYDFMPDEAIGINLAMIAGSNNTVAGNASVGFTHTMNFWSSCADSVSVGVTVQKLVGGCANTLLVDNIGSFANSFQLTVPEDGVITYAMNYMGTKSAFGGSTLSTPSYSSQSPFEGWMAKFSVGALIGSVSAINIKTLSLTVNNNLQMITDHNASNQYPSAFVSSGRSVEISFEVTAEDNLTLYNYFLNDTTNACKLELIHTALAGSASGVHSLTFNMPKVTWLGDEPTINAADTLTTTYTMTALYDSVTGYDIQAVLVNSQSGVYSV